MRAASPTTTATARDVERGEKAARDRRRFDLEREKDYRSADNGYNRSFGDKNRYRDSFRSGFAEGYRTATAATGTTAAIPAGAIHGGPAEPRATASLELPRLSRRIRGIRPGYGYGAKLRVPERRERRLPEGSRRRCGIGRYPDVRAPEVVSLGRPRLRQPLRVEGSVPSRVPARIPGRLRARVSKSWTPLVAAGVSRRQPNRRNFFIRAISVVVSTVTAPAVAVLICSRPARRAIAAIADLLDRVPGATVARRRNRSAPISTTDDVADGQHRRRARLAGQERHLAEVPAGLDARHLVARRARARR